MKILFLGPPCQKVIQHLEALQHLVHIKEQTICIDYLEECQFNFGISYRYKHIIKSDCINWFSGKLINLHISLLPWNRGADPNLWSFLENTPKGVSIHKIDEGIDTGEIIIQKQIFFDNPQETLASSYNLLSDLVEKLFVHNSDAILQENLTPQTQYGAGSFHSSKNKNQYLHLLNDLGWQTLTQSLVNKANAVKNNENV